MGVLKAGKYFIGDPCYVIPDAEWDTYLDEYVFKNDYNGVVGEFKGHNVFAAGTAYGDGTYMDNYGNDYPVDAGLIGATPLELCRDIPEEEMNEIGCVVEMNQSFTVERSTEGTFYIGSRYIVTGDEDDEEDDDHWYNDEEDDY